jgi:2-polyprenyl-3-methyl-5-hydroxy-6-metoxy-1,4-benzoquinol methylase
MSRFFCTHNENNAFHYTNYDVDTNGRYVYTGPEARKSAIAANSRQSEILHSFLSDKHFNSILDLGCGDGTFSSEFLKFPKVRILGMDPADRAIKFASEKYASEPRISFTSMSAEDLIREGQFFDIVIMRGVLHHCLDPADVINQASQLSNHVLILEPNGLNPIMKIIEKLSPYHRAHSEKSFTKAKIRSWLVESGMDINSFKYGVLVPYFFPTFMVMFMSSLEPMVAKIPLVRRVLFGTQVIMATKK